MSTSFILVTALLLDPGGAALPPQPFVRLVDLTGDERLDRLAWDSAGTGSVSVFAGGRQFIDVVQALPEVLVTEALVGDLDGDGLPDLYLVSPGPDVALLGDGSGRFLEATTALGLLESGVGRSAERLDVDGDGLHEVLLHNVEGDVLFWAEPGGTFRRADVTPGGPSGGAIQPGSAQDSSGLSLGSGPTPGFDPRVGGMRPGDPGSRPAPPMDILPSLLDDLELLFVNDDADEVDALDIADGSLTGADVSTTTGNVTHSGGQVGIGTAPARPLDVDGIIRSKTTGFEFPDGSVQSTATLLGPEGPTGPTGPVGPTGLQGVVGPTGPTGAAGATGPTGAQGLQGVVGPTGPQGAVGATGPQGIQGVAGPTGPQGLQGVVGPTGPQGAIGPTGAQGVQGAIGPTGPAGAQGPAGATGAQGVQGAVGPTGPQGLQGPAGATGAQGAQGVPGPTGAPGAQGNVGPAGPTGATGVAGAVGPEGPTGPTGPGSAAWTDGAGKVTTTVDVGIGLTTPLAELHAVGTAVSANTVLGQATGSGTSTGVRGESSSTTGRGVQGVATAVTGANRGVAGQSDSTTGRGVDGNATATTGANFGVFGSSASVAGTGTVGNASAVTGATRGVDGRVASTGAAQGVYGIASAITGANFGGFFENNSASGFGVFARANASGGVALRAENSGASGNIIEARTATDTEFRVDFDGDVFCDGAFSGGGADYAEWLPRLDSAEVLVAGDVVGVHDGFVSRTTTGARQVLVVSTRPVLVGNSAGAEDDQREGFSTIAFLGQVEVRVAGPVAAGDVLVASGRDDGLAVAIAPSSLDAASLARVIGTAWESAEGPGEHLVLAALGMDAVSLAAHALQRQETVIDALRQQVQRLEARLSQGE